MSWNYRVIKRKIERPLSMRSDPSVAEFDYDFVIKEVYYNEDDSIFLISMEPEHPSGETRSELRRNVKQMLDAFHEPTLNEWEIKFETRDGEISDLDHYVNLDKDLP